MTLACVTFPKGFWGSPIQIIKPLVGIGAMNGTDILTHMYLSSGKSQHTKFLMQTDMPLPPGADQGMRVLFLVLKLYS